MNYLTHFITYADGDEYIGEWKKGKRHGKGEFVCKGGSKYTGEYANGLMHGRGKFILKDKTIYHEGDWRCFVDLF